MFLTLFVGYTKIGIKICKRKLEINQNFYVLTLFYRCIEIKFYRSMGFLIGKLNKIWYFFAISIFETNTKSTIYSEHKAGAQEQPMGDLLTQCTEVCFASFFFGGFITVIVVKKGKEIGKTHLCALYNWQTFFYQMIVKHSYFEKTAAIRIWIHLRKWFQPIVPSFRWKGSNECAITRWIRQ